MESVKSLPEPFNFYRFVLQSDHLHFGLWPEGEETLSLEQAQERMFEALLEFFPPSPAKVLDVGCGLGLSAWQLANRGYEVVAIAPSGELISYAKEKWGTERVVFLQEGFLDAPGASFLESRYDVILFQESLQYLRPLCQVFERARSLLERDGYLVVSDEVRLSDAIARDTAVHSFTDIKVCLAEAGFRLTKDRDVGIQVRFTCDEIIKRLSAQFDAIVGQFGGEETKQKLERLIEGWKNQRQWYELRQFTYALFVARKDETLFRPYREGDEEKILKLFKTAFGKDRTLEHWEWKFKKNPYGSLYIAEAVGEQGDLHAHYCGYPVPFYHASGSQRRFLSLQIGDTMTNPKVRFSGFGKTSILSRIAHYFYQKFCMGAVPFVYGFNTGKIRKLGERYLDYEYIDPIPYYEKEVGADKERWKYLAGRILRGLRVLLVDEIGAEYDEFFEKVADDYGLLVERSSKYLRWRYLQCPDNKHYFFEVRKRGRLLGWSVFSRRDSVLIWGDALFDRRLPEAVETLLRYVTLKAFPDAKRIEAWVSPNPRWWGRLLRKLGFQEQKEPNNLAPAMVIFDKDFTRDMLGANFYYTMGDSDLF